MECDTKSEKSPGFYKYEMSCQSDSAGGASVFCLRSSWLLALAMGKACLTTVLQYHRLCLTQDTGVTGV